MVRAKIEKNVVAVVAGRMLAHEQPALSSVVDQAGERLRWKPGLVELMEQVEVAPDQTVEVTAGQRHSRRITQHRAGHPHRLCWGQEDVEQSFVPRNLVVASEPE